MLDKGWHSRGQQFLIVNDEFDYPLWSTPAHEEHILSGFLVHFTRKVQSELEWCHSITQ